MDVVQDRYVDQMPAPASIPSKFLQRVVDPNVIRKSNSVLTSDGDHIQTRLIEDSRNVGPGSYQIPVVAKKNSQLRWSLCAEQLKPRSDFVYP